MASKTVSIKKKKKNWYSIYAPDFMNNIFLGDSNVYEKEELIGKTLNLNLSTITNDMKKQNINATFKVTEVADDKGKTEIINYELSLSYVKRLVRRGRNKISDSFVVLTKDNKPVRVKPIIITNSATHKSVVSDVRLAVKKLLVKYLSANTFDNFANDLMTFKLQKDLKDKLNKIYPLKYVDIRQAHIESGKVKIPKYEISADEPESPSTETGPEPEDLAEEESEPKKKIVKKKAVAEQETEEK